MAAPIDTTTACSLLSDPIRRHVLALFRERRVWRVGDLAAAIVAQKQGRPPADVSTEDVERTQIELVHNHVPRLADHGILEWDSRSGDIVRSDRYEDLEPIDELTLDEDAERALAISEER